MAMAIKMAMIRTTTINSMRVNPCCTSRRRRARRWTAVTGYAPFGRRGRVLDSCAKGASALNAPALNASPRDAAQQPEGPTSKSRLAAFVWGSRDAGAAAQLELWRMSSKAGGSRAGDGASEALADVRLSPDAGLQTFSEPYPSIQRDGTMRRSYIPGRAIVHVSAVKGDWAQVSVDGDAVGWVDGRQLL